MARTKRRCFLFPAAAGCCVVAAGKFPGALLSCLIFDSHRLSAVDTRTGRDQETAYRGRYRG